MFSDDENEDRLSYSVVVNHEEQYSIWPEYKETIPLGWNQVGMKGKKHECLDWIEQIWTDMRPLSLQKRMAQLAAEEAENPGASLLEVEDVPTGPPLVERLADGRHPVIVSRARDLAKLKEHIDRGYVLLKFTDTQGGTELGSRLDPSRCKLDGADFERGSGHVTLVGNLTLDYVPVELVAEIDLATLQGSGWLVVLPESDA